MNIQAIKLELMKSIINTENPSVLAKIMKIVQNEQNDFWNQLSSEEKEDIIGGLMELDNGESFDYHEFMKSHR